MEIEYEFRNDFFDFDPKANEFELNFDAQEQSKQWVSLNNMTSFETQEHELIGSLIGLKVYSKECLKFGRRISKLMLRHLSNYSAFSQHFLDMSAQVTNTIRGAFALKEAAKKDLIRDQYLILRSIWKEFRDCLSYHTNKKICIVKPEYWNIVFNRKNFIVCAKRAIESLQKDFLLNSPYEEARILDCMCEVLFGVNQLMTLTFILADTSDDGGKHMRGLDNIENLLVMIVDAGLFEFYNHRSGKFARECCGRCKICGSRAVPWNFLSLLQAARKKLKTISELIPSTFSSDLWIVNSQQLFYLLSLLVKL